MILIIDDEAMVRDTLSDSLSLLGIHSLQCSRPEDVKEILKKIRFRWVMTDIGMPGKNGIELIKEVNNEFPEVKFICVSGFTSVLDADLKDLSVELVLQKPFDIATLKEELSKLEGFF